MGEDQFKFKGFILNLTLEGKKIKSAFQIYQARVLNENKDKALVLKT
ncbi:hypothetical protein GCM10009865_43900 [Aeromicrobium ponti]